MTDDELKQRLQGLPVPAEDESARARALHRASLALAHGPSREEVPPPRWRRFLLPLSVVGLAATALLLWPHSSPPVSVPAHEPTTAWTTLKQMEALFPGQLDAVIEKHGKFELEIAAEESGPCDQPLLVKMISGGEAIQILSYSGRTICVDLHGRATCFEVLITGDGQIILSGENFLWTSQAPVTVAGYSIEARQLTPTS